LSLQPTGCRKDWATIVSTPYLHENRFVQSASAEEEPIFSDAPSFTEVRSKRSLRKKRKLESATPLAQATTNQISNQQPTQNRRPVVIGKSTINCNNMAAMKIVKKAVFCVDNISTAYTASDIISFLSETLEIEALSCFEVKPRHRRSEEFTGNRKAFRLCIRDTDRFRLLDADRWPDSVKISDWIFKHNENRDEESKRANTVNAPISQTADRNQPGNNEYDTSNSNKAMNSSAMISNVTTDADMDATIIQDDTLIKTVHA
jgi:hypothetical protein